ncbi:MAG: hypothetical protein ACTSWY_14105 [Promethearchaeota archaeon]
MKIKKKRDEGAKKIRLCPKCRRPTLKSAFNVSGWLANAMFKCTNPECGYVGSLYIEADIDENNENPKNIGLIEKSEKKKLHEK